MKRVTLLLVAFLFATFGFAQLEPTTTVNIILADVISIDGGSMALNGDVSFEYKTAESYNTSQTINVPNSLIVTSTKPFNIHVKANGANFLNVGGSYAIPVSVVTIKRSGGTILGLNNHNVILNTSYQNLIHQSPLGSALNLNLDYTIPAIRSTSDILGKKAGTYTQDITYTATAL